MSQQVRVSRCIQFVGDANEEANIKGNLSTNKMCVVDWFNQTALDTTNDYTVTVGGTNDSIALTAAGKHGVTLLSGDTDNEVCFMGTALIFDITQNPIIECKVNISDISQSSFYFGFSDANTESTPASTIDYADETLAAAATDAAGFVSDADKSSSLFYAAYIKTGGSVAGASTGVTPTDTSWHVLRVKLDSSGNCTWYIDGKAVYYKAAAVTDVPLCAIFNAGTRDDGGGDPIYVKYLKAWQDV